MIEAAAPVEDHCTLPHSCFFGVCLGGRRPCAIGRLQNQAHLAVYLSRQMANVCRRLIATSVEKRHGASHMYLFIVFDTSVSLASFADFFTDLCTYKCATLYLVSDRAGDIGCQEAVPAVADK